MSLIVKTLPGVYGGVSNQTTSLRKDNQVTEMVNCIPSLVLGTTRRPNAEATASLAINSDASFIYDYKRDDGEANVLTVNTGGAIKAYRLDTGAIEVTTTPEVTEYLTHTNKNSLSGITIGDTTFIVNSEKTVELVDKDTTSMVELDELYRSPVTDGERYSGLIAYYWISKSSNDPDHPYNYVVELDGVKYEAESDKADYAARKLVNKIKYVSKACNIQSSVPTGQTNSFTVTIREGSVVGSGALIDLNGFTWTSIDGMITTANTGGAITWTRTSTGTYTVTVNTANSKSPISYLLNIGEQEFLDVVDATVNDVASNFSTQLNGFVGTFVTPEFSGNGFDAEVNGAVLKIYKTDYSDFIFNYWDSWGSLASYGWKPSVGKLQDLPASFPWDGTVAKVASSDGNAAAEYYVIRWKGSWREYTTRAIYEGAVRKLPMLTNMPIVIERLANGTFSARLLTTADQLRPPLVGNSENNKDPYFVGKKIKQLFYINGRICIVAGDGLTFSQTDVIWNFYATTIINVLDGDTIEIKIASEKVLEILRVAIFQSGLLIMTSEGQYLFNTEQGIAPSTIIVNKLSNYAYSDAGGTVYDGDSIVFSGITGDTSRLYRYRVARLTSENKAIDLTIQVPTYIVGTIVKVAAFVEDGTLIVLTENSKKLYMYREVVSGDQMVQSSWYSWDFSKLLPTNNILHIMVINSDLYIITYQGTYRVPLGVQGFESTYEHLDAGTAEYDSYIELTKWRPKKTNAQIQTPRGRLQLRTVTASLDGSAALRIYKEDRNFTQSKPIYNNKNINILSNTDKTVLSIINDGLKPFTISSISLSGTYRDKGIDRE